MTGISDYGTVTDYLTGEPVRPATGQEWRRTADKMASDDGDNYTGAWRGSDGRAVYVDGGPEADIAHLRTMRMYLSTPQPAPGPQRKLTPAEMDSLAEDFGDYSHYYSG